MKFTVWILSFAAILVLAACTTAPEASVTDYSGETVLIQVKSPGISPSADGFFDVVEFLVSSGKNYTPDRWALDILDPGKKSIRNISGQGQPPATLAWDGFDDAGQNASDGQYHARISIWFPGAAVPNISESAAFILDSTGPEGTVSFSEGLFSPDGDGVNDSLGIEIKVTDKLSEGSSWTLSIYDSHGAEVKSFYSEMEPDGIIVWDGMKDGNMAVGSASDYDAILTSRDSLGNTSVTKSGFSTDILVIKENDQLRIRVNSITFKAYTANYMDVSAEEQQSNEETLDLLAAKLKKFPGYKITLEGHAVSVFWDNPAKAAKENTEVLTPLSLARADAVRDALAERGLNAESMKTVGLGATRPIVPFSDLQNRWKNRRVVFILTK